MMASISRTVVAGLIMVSTLLLLLFSVLSLTAESKVVAIDHLVEGSGLVSANLVEKVPLWNAVPMLLAPVTVTVNCSSGAYSVLTASSSEQLLADSASKVLWCGWKNIITEPNVCQFRLSTLQDTFFAVKPSHAGLLALGQPELTCSVTTTAGDLTGDLLWRFTAVSAAVFLFRHAADMARSQTFRLTSGGVLGVSGFAVILVFILFRHAPAKKAISAGFAVSTAGMVALARWAVSTWGPGVQHVVLSRVGVWYVILTGATGVALTYWLDDPNNEKINTSIRVGLQGLSLAVVYACVADERAAITAVLLLMVHKWLLAILRYTGGWLLSLAGFIHGATRSSTHSPSGSLLELPDDWEEEEYCSSQDSDYEPSEEEDDDVKEGIVTERDDDESQEEEEDQAGVQAPAGRQQRPAAQAAPAAAAGSSQQWRGLFGWRTAAQSVASGGVEGVGAAGAGSDELGPAPSFDRWAKPREQPGGAGHAAQAAAQSSLAGAAAAGNAGEGRAPGPSGCGWGPALLAVDRRQGTNYQQQHQQQPEPAVQQRPGSTSPPWSERKVLDITEPKLPSPPAAGAGGRGHLGPAGVDGAVGPTVSTLVEADKIINPETGRPISMHGPKYKELLDRGYEPDLVAGILVLHGGHQSTPPAAAAGSFRGGPSPASNLRSRKSGRMQTAVM